MFDGLTRYRISHPTLVLIPSSSNNGRYEGAQVIPEGAVVIGAMDGNTLLSDEQLVEVIWNGQKVKMLAQDLRTIAERIPAPTVEPLRVGDRVRWSKALSSDYKNAEGTIIRIVPVTALPEFTLYDIRFEFGMHTLLSCYIERVPTP